MLDKKDKEILKVLLRDSRVSMRRIARELKLSPGTVQLRIKKLEDMGIINRYTVNIDFEKLGYNFPVIIDVRVSKGRLFEVEEIIAKHPNVISVYDITGEYDVSILARFKNRGELDRFVKDIQRMDYVERTYTKLILNIIKENKWDTLI